MVERSWLDESYNDPFADTSASQEGKSVWDFPLNFGKRAAGIGADLGSIVRAIGEESIDPEKKSGRATAAFGEMIQTIFGELEEGAEGMMSPAAQRALQLTATSPEFYQLGNLMLQGAGMLPDVAVAVVPALKWPGMLSAAGIAASQGASFGAGELTDELYRITDNMTDEELREEVPYYRDLRDSGMDEENARIQWNSEFRGLRPLITGMVGAVTNTLGPAGQAARVAGGAGRAALTSGAEAGLARRLATGAAEGFVSEAVEEGTQAAVLQDAEIEIGRREGFDLGEIGEAALTGGVLGGLMGGGIGGVSGRRSREPGKAGAPEDAMPGTETTAELPPVSTTAPNQPGGGVPAEGPSMEPAAGAVAPSTTQPETGSIQSADIATADAQPALVPVDVAGPAPDQAAALGSQLATTERTAAPDVELPAAAPEVSQPSVVQPVQEVAPAVTQAPAQQVGPVTAEGNTIPVEQPQPVRVANTVAAPPSGPRVLEAVDSPDYTAAHAQQVARNIIGMEPVAEKEGGGSNLGKDEVKQRLASIEKSKELFGKYKPREEENGILSHRAAEREAAKPLILERAKAIYQDALDQGVTIPDRLRDTKNKDIQFPAEMITLMEARRLATKDKPSLADFKRFRQQEVGVVLGREEAVSARRADGDAAMKRGVAKGQDSEAAMDAALTKAETSSVSDALTIRNNPESQLIDAQESRDTEVAQVTKTKEEVEAESKQRRADDGPVPKVVQDAVDAAIAQAMRKSSSPKAVERVKRRKIDPAKRVEQSKLSERKAGKLTIAAARTVADVKERLAKARGETNTTPTEAQKEAGNYKKGSVSIAGLTARIENPVGSERSGTSPDGTKWSVKMRHDYGYIEGTKGADGEPIDVFIGPNLDSTYVYVVDQVDPDTRVFDEHKVMLGFRTEEAAYMAYNRAFSDNSAALRVESIRRMTMDEFKRWLDTDPSQRSSATRAEVAEVQAYIRDEMVAPMDAPLTAPNGYVVNPANGRIGPVLSSRTASSIIDDMNLSGLIGAQRTIAGQSRRMLSELVGDTPVHFVTPQVIQHLSAENFPPKGMYSEAVDGTAAIFIRSDLMNDPDALRHAVLHEATHAATLRAIDRDPALENQIKDLMGEVYSELTDTGVFFDTDLDAMEYGMVSAKEFIAEVFSNPAVQGVLQRMDASPSLLSRLKIPVSGRIRSAWDALIHTVRKGLGLSEPATTMLEAALRLTERAMKPATAAAEAKAQQAFLRDGSLKPIMNSVRKRTDALLGRSEMQFSEGRPWMIAVRTMDSIARQADRFFGGEATNPFRTIARLVEARRVRASKHYEKATPLLEETAELERRYTKMRGDSGQSVWENYTNLIIDETISGVYADVPLSDQKHINKGARDSWKRAQHPSLSKRYGALPDELKQHRRKMLDHFKSEQEQLSRLLIRNQINHLFDTADAQGMADRVFERKTTDADKELLGDYLSTIERAGVLGKIDGPYFPLMRRGNWVVSARSGITPPSNARAIGRNEFEFTTEEAAEAYAGKQSGYTTVNTVYVDPTTGETFGVEDDGTQVRLTSQDINAEARYRVVVQDKHVEMFDSEREARERAADLQKAGLDVDDVAPRKFNTYGSQAEALSPQLMQMMQVMERRARSRNMSEEQVAEMMQATNEMAMQFMSATRIQTRSIPRRNVAGASTDITRNAHDYALAMGNHVAKLETSPQINAELARAQTFIDENRQDGGGAARQAIMNEVAKRITQTDPRNEGGAAPVVNRILAVSFIDKLMSPSYSVINATQPYMITMPYLAGNFGVMRANSAMARAYRDIGTLQTIREGAVATAAKARSGSSIPTDPVSLIMGRLKNPRERAMLDYMVEFGALDTDSGLEVSRYVKSGKGLTGRFDAGMGYLEGIARQMPKSVEAINRSVSALAAYRLEMERSGNHDKAVTFAYDTINKTQFNYSSSNATPYMNHPLLRLATQFKKYGIGMYQHLGEQAGIAINRSSTPQERAVAIKTLSMTIGMHVLIAGAMGLPTEPIKMVVTAANAFGVIDWSWEDVEIGQREALAGLMGRDLGEALSRGVPRIFGVDLSTRMGIDTLMGPFGEPRSNEAQDLKAWMWDALSGAPAGLIVDMTGGVKSMAEGDVLRGMEKLVPIKAFADSLKAYRQMSEGTISQRTGRQILSPYSAGEAVMRGLGFAPSREAEAFERSNMFYRQRDVQEEARKDFMREWSDANSGARGRVWRDIQKWNKGVHKDARISLSDLRSYQKRIKADMKETHEGLRARRREKHILDRASETFNFE